MSTSLPPVRRIVTGIDANGRSYIAEDGVSPAMMTMAGARISQQQHLAHGRQPGAGRRQPIRCSSIAACCRRRAARCYA